MWWRCGEKHTIQNDLFTRHWPKCIHKIWKHCSSSSIRGTADVATCFIIETNFSRFSHFATKQLAKFVCFFFSHRKWRLCLYVRWKLLPVNFKLPMASRQSSTFVTCKIFIIRRSEKSKKNYFFSFYAPDRMLCAQQVSIEIVELRNFSFRIKICDISFFLNWE